MRKYEVVEGIWQGRSEIVNGIKNGAGHYIRLHSLTLQPCGTYFPGPGRRLRGHLHLRK